MSSRKIQVGIADDEEPKSDKERALEERLDKMLAVSGSVDKNPDKTEPNAPKKVAITFSDSADIDTFDKSSTSTSENDESNSADDPKESDEFTDEKESKSDENPRPVPQLVRLGWRENQAVLPNAPELPKEDVHDVALILNEIEPEAVPTNDEPNEAPKVRSIPVMDAAADNEKSSESELNEPVKTQNDNRLKRWLRVWWNSKKLRYGSFAVVVLIIAALAILPPTQAMALNLFGVRADATFKVLDATTKLPLSGASVSVGAAQATSDDSGTVSLKDVKLGSQTLTIKKLAFVTNTSSIKLSSGNNKLAAINLKPDGTQYTFSLKDYVTGGPVTNARATSGESSAVADKNGLITLTVKPTSDKLAATITSSGYRKTEITVSVGKSGSTPILMVTADKELYVSKQSGKYDVYKSDIDGQNKKVILAGTGNESAQIGLLPSNANSFAALVSTRDNTKDDDGYLLRTLTLINVDSGVATTIDHSQSIQLIDWMGDKLVYVEAKAGASAANPSRYQLYSYDAKSNQRLLLDHANYFNDVVSANGSIYYATSNQYSGGVSQFNKINADNSGKQTLLTNEVWDIFRTGYSTFALDTAAGWYNYKIGDSKPSAGTAYNGQSHVYIDSDDGNKSLWVDLRDGKGTLLMYDVSAEKDIVVKQQDGLTYPVRWLNKDTIVYRVKTAAETADYVVSASGGTPKKITDVTNTSGAAFFQGQ